MEYYDSANSGHGLDHSPCYHPLRNIPLAEYLMREVDLVVFQSHNCKQYLLSDSERTWRSSRPGFDLLVDI